jgi:hypothetical protein
MLFSIHGTKILRSLKLLLVCSWMLERLQCRNNKQEEEGLVTFI